MLLVAACAGAVVAAVLVVGQGSAPAAQQRVVTASRGVVQSTVSGSGTLEAPETDVNFASSGRLTDVYVKAGQHVVEGQKLASIDSSDAEISLEQAQANLRSAEAKLEQAEAGGSSSSSSSATATAGAAANSPQRPSAGNSSSSSQNSAETAATKAANIASAQADVDSAQLAVDSANRTLADTTLTAPAAGTVASVNGAVGDIVSGGASNNSNASNGSNNSSGSGGNGSTGSNGSNGSSGGSGSGSSSAFIVIVDRGGMTLQVPFSESDIHKIKKRQPATITVNGVPGLELAAHVRSIDTLPTTNNSVVSYNVTFALDQKSSSLKPGMTATAEVVVTRVNDTVNVPTSAISRRGASATVNLWKNGKSTTQPVVTGLAGDSTTQIISGLKAGDEVAIPIATNLGSSASPFGNRGTGGGGTLGGGGGGGLLGGGARRPVVIGPGP